MDRHIELSRLFADLNQQVDEAQACAKTATDQEERNRSGELLAELLAKRGEVKQELRQVVIAEGEVWREELENTPKRPPPPLSAGTIARLELLFKQDDQASAREVLLRLSDQRFCERPAEAERVWIAALKLSCGNLAVLAKAIETANGDYRDLLLEAGFANDPKEHLKWWPGQPAPWYARRLPPPSN